MQSNGQYARNDGEKIWWKNTDTIGEWVFSFDMKKDYNMYHDYPHNMTKDEVELFDKENPYWANYFKDRKV